MPQNTKNGHWIQFTKKQKIFVYVAVFSTLILLFDIFYAGNIHYYAKWSECGHKPYGVRHEFLRIDNGPESYTQDREFINASSDLFCTPKEAELSGYSGDPNIWQLNHVNNAQGDCAISMSGTPGVTSEQIYQTCKDK